METKRQKGQRPIEINGRYWGWMVGKINVVIFDPDRNKTVVRREVLQVGDDVRIMPGAVGRYIRNRLVTNG